jgi:hypothetical protein
VSAVGSVSTGSLLLSVVVRATDADHTRRLGLSKGAIDYLE